MRELKLHFPLGALVVEIEVRLGAEGKNTYQKPETDEGLEQYLECLFNQTYQAAIFDKAACGQFTLEDFVTPGETNLFTVVTKSPILAEMLMQIAQSFENDPETFLTTLKNAVTNTDTIKSVLGFLSRQEKPDPEPPQRN